MLQANVAMTGPIMSRFDLFFVIIDECNEVIRYALSANDSSLNRCLGVGL